MALKKNLGSLLVVGLCTALSCALAYLTADPAARLLGLPALVSLAVLALAVQWLMFVPAYIAQTEHYYDLTGSATYLVVVWLAVWAAGAGGPGARTLLLATLVSIWALRLGSFLFRRVRQSGKDGRFDEIKPDWARFLVAWTLQGVWVFVTLIAALIAMTSTSTPSVDAWAVAGTLIWALGFGIEALADAQKAASKRMPPTPENSSTSASGPGLATPTTSAKYCCGWVSA